MQSRHPLALAALLSVLVAGCGDDDGTAGVVPSADVDAPVQLLLQSAPSAELLALEARIESFRLERVDGTSTEELFPAPQSVELFGLGQRAALIASRPVPAGSYRAVELRISPQQAKDPSGVTLPAGDGATWRVELDPPRDLGGADGGRLALEIDLVESVEVAPGGGPIDLAPEGAPIPDAADDDLLIDDLFGLVIAEEPALGRFRIEGYLSADAPTPIGEVEVVLADEPLLLGLDDEPLADAAALFDALVPGQSIVEVSGRVSSGPSVLADRIEIELELGPDGSVRIEGIVVALPDGDPLPPEGTFELLIVAIEQGELLAASVLDELEDPTTVAVAYDGSTLFLLDDDDDDDRGGDDDEQQHPGLGAPVDLALGQRVDVRFAEFVSAPFLAAEVELDDVGGSYEGRVHDVSGLPESFVLRLSSDEPAVHGGAVDSATTDVVVELDGSEAIELQLPGQPALVALDLLVDLRVRVRGDLIGPSDAPRIVADDLLVRPGRLQNADVTGVDASAMSFTTSGGMMQQSFGENVLPGPLTILVEPNVFAPGAASLVDLFEQLAEPGARADVRGIGSGEPNTVRAFWVKPK